MNEEKELLYCPFCGSWSVKITGKRRGNYRREGTNYQVICSRCHARGPIVQDEKREAEWKWNGRYNPSKYVPWIITDNISYYMKNKPRIFRDK